MASAAVALSARVGQLVAAWAETDLEAINGGRKESRQVFFSLLSSC